MSPAPKLATGTYVRLSIMMFFQYAIWGAWLPLLWPYLETHRGLDGTQISRIFAIGAVGAIVAPFVAGQVADRYFSTQRFLGISHLIGAFLVWKLASIETYDEFLWFSLAYSLVYAPTVPLTNSLSFHHLPDIDRDFGRIRTWGTVGWVVVGISVGQWLLHKHTPANAPAEEVLASQFAGMSDAFRVSAILGLIMGLYCFLLPHTPPSKEGQKNATFEALGSIKRQPLLTLFLLAVPVSMIHQFYFVHTAKFLGNYQVKSEVLASSAGFINKIFGVGGVGLMALGQVSEIFVLAAIPMIAKKISRKTFLAIGLVAYGIRMLIFANVEAIPGAVQVPTLLLGILMHGLCFGCFIFVSFMIVDEETPKDVRASAQSLYNLVIIGVGIIVGSIIAGEVDGWAKTKPEADYFQNLFTVPMWASLMCLIALFVMYPRRRGTSEVTQ